jgi:hypothetical protein
MPRVITGSTADANNSLHTCSHWSMQDKEYDFIAPKPGLYRIALEADRYASLSVKNGTCFGSELSQGGCGTIGDDDVSTESWVQLTQGQHIVIVVEAPGAHPFTLTIHPPTACSNGLDDDGDGVTDFPNEKGCESSRDDDEVDPAVTQCSDGIDNDGDQLVDSEDPQCLGQGTLSEGLVCDTVTPTPLSSTQMPVWIQGTTSGESLFTIECYGSYPPSPEKAFSWVAPAEGWYTVDTNNSAFQTLLGVYRSLCELDDVLECDVGSGTTPGASRVMLHLQAHEPIFIVVDGAGEQGAFSLSIRQVPAP